MRFQFLTAILCACAALPASARAEVKPALLFTDNAVIQRGMKIPVWGKAKNGEKVTVKFAGQERTTAAKEGAWRVDFDSVQEAGPYEMTIAGSNTITLKNLLVGEVWLCGGQSNMQFKLSGASDGKEAITASANPNIRLFDIIRWGAAEGERKLQNRWLKASPETTGNFSAIGYYFGLDLQKRLDVPVGLISSNYGGTDGEAWLSRETLATEPEILERYETAVKDKRRAGGLYNGMIKPLAPYAMRGVIWYQGENNISHAEDYQRLLSLLIGDWRKTWGQGDFPFLIVQLAPFGNGRGRMAEVREAQINVAKNSPNTASVVTTDVGNAFDIHPKEKRPIAERLALAARAMAYGEKVQYRGPTFAEAKFENGAATVKFDHVSGSLVVNGKEVKGFKVAGADKKFYKADAKIMAPDTVVVSSPEVKEPVAVRFAWEDMNVADLWGGGGLPVEPFRTDDYPPALSTK